MGANMLALYLIREGDKSPLKGAVCYGLPYNLKDNVPFFKNNGHKFYNTIMGLNVYLILKSKLPELKELLSQDEYLTLLSRLESNNFNMMDLD